MPSTKQLLFLTLAASSVFAAPLQLEARDTTGSVVATTDATTAPAADAAAPAPVAPSTPTTPATPSAHRSHRKHGKHHKHHRHGKHHGHGKHHRHGKKHGHKGKKHHKRPHAAVNASAPATPAAHAVSAPASPALSARSWSSFKNTVKNDWPKAEPYVKGAAQVAATVAPFVMRDVDEAELDERSWKSFKQGVKNDWNKAKPYVEAAGHVIGDATQVAGNIAPYIIKDAPKRRDLDDIEDLNERSWSSFKGTVKKDWNKAKPYVKGAAQVAATVAPFVMREVDEAELDERSWNSFKQGAENDWNQAKPYVQAAGTVISDAAQVAGNVAPYIIKDAPKRRDFEDDLEEFDERSWNSFKQGVKNDWNKAEPYVQSAGHVIGDAAQIAGNIAPYIVKDAPKKRDLEDDMFDLDERSWAGFKNTVKKDWNKAKPYVKGAAQVAATVAPLVMRDVDETELDERSWNGFKQGVKNDWNKAKPYFQAAGNFVMGATQVASNVAPYLKKAPKARSLDDAFDGYDLEFRDFEDDGLELDERSWSSFKQDVKNDWNKAKPYVQDAANVAGDVTSGAKTVGPWLAKAPKARSLEELD